MQKHAAKYTRLHARRFCIWTAVTAVGHISLSGARKVQEKPSGPAKNHAFGPAAFSCSYLSGSIVLVPFVLFNTVTLNFDRNVSVAMIPAFPLVLVHDLFSKAC